MVYKIFFELSDGTYIGSTTNFARRKSEHLSKLKSGRHHSLKLQRAFEKYGERAIRFEILAVVDDESSLLLVEQRFLDDLKPRYNMAPTSAIPSRDPHVRMKIAASLRGRKRNPEIGRKSGAKQLGKTLCSQVRRKISVALTGRRRPDAVRSKISEAHKGREKSAAHRENIRKALLGRNLSPDHRQNISKSLKGRVVTDETRRKISESNKGRETSNAQRAKLSASAPNKQRVRCIETGELFESLSAAAKARGKTRQSLKCHLLGVSKTFDGHTWAVV